MKKSIALAIIRHTLTFVGGIVLAKGWLDETTVQEVSGAVIAVVGAIWSVFDKTKSGSN